MSMVSSNMTSYISAGHGLPAPAIAGSLSSLVFLPLFGARDAVDHADLLVPDDFESFRVTALVKTVLTFVDFHGASFGV